MRELNTTFDSIKQIDENNAIRHNVSKKGRDLMIDMDTELPEKLPTPDKDIQIIERVEISKIKISIFY